MNEYVMLGLVAAAGAIAAFGASWLGRTIKGKDKDKSA